MAASKKVEPTVQPAFVEKRFQCTSPLTKGWLRVYILFDQKLCCCRPRQSEDTPRTAKADERWDTR